MAGSTTVLPCGAVEETLAFCMVVHFKAYRLKWLFCVTWWRNEMEPFSALLALCWGWGGVCEVGGWGTSTSHRWIPLTNASDAELWYFSFICAWTNRWRQWFETPQRSFWRHCNEFGMFIPFVYAYTKAQGFSSNYFPRTQPFYSRYFVLSSS